MSTLQKDVWLGLIIFSFLIVSAILILLNKESSWTNIVAVIAFLALVFYVKYSNKSLPPLLKKTGNRQLLTFFQIFKRIGNVYLHLVLIGGIIVVLYFYTEGFSTGIEDLAGALATLITILIFYGIFLWTFSD